MRKRFICLSAGMMIAAAMLFAGCGDKNTEPTNTVGTTTAPEDNKTIPGTSTVDKGKDDLKDKLIGEKAAEFVDNVEAVYLRTDYYDGEDNEKVIFLLTSVEELNGFYGSTSAERPLVEQYGAELKDFDEDFFTKNVLMVVKLIEGSGSVRHKVKRLEFAKDAEGKRTLRPIIQWLIPEAGTCDMASWHILIPVSRDKQPEECVLLENFSDFSDDDFYEDAGLQKK